MSKTTPQPPSPAEVQQVVWMKQVSSLEHIPVDSAPPQPVLSGIDLQMERGQSWGICGDSLYELKLLLEIVANLRPYDKGQCVLMERGMMRRKRRILHHVFYIGSAQMLYDNMNVLEYLMFATDHLWQNSVEKQEQIFEYLIQIGLGHICLTTIRLLTKEERAVVTLLAAAYSPCNLVVLNLPQYTFDEPLRTAVGQISLLLRASGHALLISTPDAELIERSCTHAAYLHKGRLLCSGSVLALKAEHDRVAVVLQDRNLPSLQERLELCLPNCELRLQGNRLLVLPKETEPVTAQQIYEAVTGAGLAPDRMERNPKTLKNAFEELVAQHDLSEQLL